MKDLLIPTVLLFISCSVVSGQYAEKKSKFNYKEYSYQAGDRYEPSLAGVCSFLIPGLGQVASGETARGLGFLSGYVLSYGMILGSVDHEGNIKNLAQARTGAIGLIVIWIWSIVDAVQVAKVNNLALREKNKISSIRLQPTILPNGNSNKIATGLRLSIKLK